MNLIRDAGAPERPELPGDEGALAWFAEVIDAHLDAMHALARYLMRDAHDAEDAVQDAALRALRHARTFGGGDERAWLLTIVRNRCLSLLRRRRRAAPMTALDEDLQGGSDADIEAELLGRMSHDDIVRAMNALPDEFREVLVLRELQDCSYQEIARITSVPVGTVMSRLSRARRRMQALLGTYAMRERRG